LTSFHFITGGGYGACPHGDPNWALGDGGGRSAVQLVDGTDGVVAGGGGAGTYTRRIFLYSIYFLKL
jgi:hypothetical protein